jgi:hypothetical protein
MWRGGREVREDTSARAVPNASASAPGATLPHGAASSAQSTTVPEDNASPFVEFAHGTTHELGLNVINIGLSYTAGRAAELGSKEPGSFFTVKVNPSNPYEALSVAASWGARRGGSVSVVLLRLPQPVVESLEAAGSLVHNTIPVESIFRPVSFDVVNREAQWSIVAVRG